MHIVPVIDLKAGCVVHARRGLRAEYRPLVSTLCADAVPRNVVAALLACAGTRTLYVADLDALEGRGDHAAIVGELLARHADLAIWLDCGLAPAYDALPAHLSDRIRPVLGTESATSRARIAASGPAALAGAIVSLDHRDGVPLAALSEALPPPGTVIAMDLARVGSEEGPDCGLLARLRRRFPACRLYAAGGIRHRADLDACARAGANGALVATAIHAGTLAPGTG